MSVWISGYSLITSGCVEITSPPPQSADSDMAPPSDRRAPDDLGTSRDLALDMRREVIDREVVSDGEVERLDMASLDAIVEPADAMREQDLDQEPDQELDQELGLDYDVDMIESDMSLADMEPPRIDEGIEPQDMSPVEPDMDPPPPEEVCGDLRIGPNEMCDDGNAITEACPYGVRSCVVCDAQCQEVPGVVAYCGDGALSHNERCDEGEDR